MHSDQLVLSEWVEMKPFNRDQLVLSELVSNEAIQEI